MAEATFKDKIIIVTGASSGIGKALAFQLAEQGARLTIAARDALRLQEAAAECHERGGQALVVPADLTDPKQCQNLVERAVEEYGGIDTLVNNAGVGMWTKFEDVQDLGIFERLMRVNYLSAVYCTFYALPYLKKSRGGIIGVSSLAGKNGVPARSGYCASKHAMVGFFDTLRIELADSGVAVTMAYPDFVATGARSRNLGADGKPVVHVPPYDKTTMTTETCARLIVQGAARRDREIVMTMRGRLGPWVKFIAPNLVDRIARRAIERGR